jgi:DNA-directed RNA polymerase
MTDTKPPELALVATTEKPAALIESEKQTVKRFERREALKTKRGAPFVEHAEGNAFCEELLPKLAEFMLSREAPIPPKGGLSVVIRELASEELALVALSPLLHGIAVGRKKNDKSAAMKLKLAMGSTLHRKCLMKGLLKTNRKAYNKVRKAKNKHCAVWPYREPDWSNKRYLRAGNWLLNCVLKKFPEYFVLDGDKFPCVTKAGEDLALRLSAELVPRDPVFLPSTEPLRDWTGWRKGGYWDDNTRISATFVRNAHHPATEKAIRRAFGDGSMKQHVDGVNALQRVAWTINARMLPVVEKFAGKVGKKVSESQVARDIATAKYIGAETFRIPMNCDKRGRVYGVSHFNFQREDHVRALFQFAEGMPIGQDGDHNWIARHVVTCGNFDGVGKRSTYARMDWVEANIELIEHIAQKPEDTVDLWCKADSPFSFVAGCIELASVLKTGPNYITRLPVCFDGSCSGIQHLSMMLRDEDAGRFVNLIPDDEPHDVYQLITDRVKKRLQTAPEPQDWKTAIAKAKADWWLRRGIDRKLVKRPAMTFAYNVSLSGMQDHLDEIENDGDTFFLAWHIMEACKETLRRPAEAMEFIRKLAKECVDKGKVLEWTTPTGFPWANRYYESKRELVELELDGVRVTHLVADGYEPGLRKEKSMDAAAPNFVQGLDATHMIRVANTAAGEGISIVGVHDSVGCPAPRAARVHKIIREEMAKLYDEHDVLTELQEAAGSSLELPKKGRLDPRCVQYSTYAFA